MSRLRDQWPGFAWALVVALVIAVGTVVVLL